MCSDIMVKKDLPLRGGHRNEAPEMTACEIVDKLMLPIPSIVEVNGADLDDRVERVPVEQNCTSGVMSHMKMTRQVFVLEVLNCVLQSNDVPSPRNVFSMAPSLPRRGPGVQFRMLRRVCSSKRLGTLLLKRYSGLGEQCLLSLCFMKDGLGTALTDQVAFQD